MRDGALSLSDEGAKRGSDQGKILIGESDTWPFQ
jgi:hypothetical protein